jgi:hypothetical protein
VPTSPCGTSPVVSPSAQVMSAMYKF